MHITLDDRVAVVTGGGSGIGAEISRLLAECGAKVGIISRDEAELRSVVDQIRQTGGVAMACAADVKQDEEVERAVRKFAERWNRIDILVSNAGTNGKWAPIDEMTPDEWRETIDVNLTGTYLAIHHCVPYLRKAGGGSIVLVSSINGTRTFSNEGASAYAASKAAQCALGKMLALELAPSQIRVNVICPGAIDTDIHDKTDRGNLDRIETPVEFPEGNIPLTKGKMGTPRQVAELTAFLVSDAAIHITGSPVWIDGGQSLIT